MPWPVSYTHLDVYKRQVVYKVGISDKVLGILVVVIYIVATFAGGFVTGDVYKRQDMR